MKGRNKGTRERIILLAHQTESMARQKTLRPPHVYLRQKTRARANDTAGVVKMLRNMEAKGAGVRIERVPRRPKSGE